MDNIDAIMTFNEYIILYLNKGAGRGESGEQRAESGGRAEGERRESGERAEGERRASGGRAEYHLLSSSDATPNIHHIATPIIN